ncbi:RHS repeat domain-containing protein [Tenacibaculum sp. TC6]|uniref:RHS repeat domain-containing protein n=1 Tax=Tenacibaculum sp. TC6 TaxID=3423223 RepID=UPI003D3613A8
MRQLGVAATSTTDYYPFGMPMPNRRTVNGEPYRYAYQGQEKDPETGKEAFQLRLWDARIGRWLSPDPYGQYHSPYLGMGNNPIVRVDPDGGRDCFVDGKRVPCGQLGESLGDYGYLFSLMHEGDNPIGGDYHQMTLQEVTVNGSNGGNLNWKNILYNENQNIQNSIRSAQRRGGMEFLNYLSVVNPWMFSFGASAQLVNVGKNGFQRYAWKNYLNTSWRPAVREFSYAASYKVPVYEKTIYNMMAPEGGILDLTGSAPKGYDQYWFMPKKFWKVEYTIAKQEQLFGMRYAQSSSIRPWAANPDAMPLGLRRLVAFSSIPLVVNYRIHSHIKKQKK